MSRCRNAHHSRGSLVLMLATSDSCLVSLHLYVHPPFVLCVVTHLEPPFLPANTFFFFFAFQVPGKLCSLKKAALCSTCQDPARNDPSLHLRSFSPPCNWADQGPRPPKSCTEGRCWVLLSASPSKPICPKSSPAAPACPAAASALTSNGIPCYCRGFPRKREQPPASHLTASNATASRC